MIAKVQTIEVLVAKTVPKKETGTLMQMIKDSELGMSNNPYHKPDRKEKLKVLSS